MNKKIKTTLNILIVLMITSLSAQNTEKSEDLNQQGALELIAQAKIEAKKMNKNVSIAVLNSSGVTIILLKGDNVGPHNTEASRRKAYTSVSTKTASWDLMKKASSDSTSMNLNTLPELLLLGGGVPIWKGDNLVGSIGISGGGSGKNDHTIAIKTVENLGFKTTK